MEEVPLRDNAPLMQMPRYRSHKEVWALKIAAVEDPTLPGNESDGSRELGFADEGHAASVRVSRSWALRHNPQVGGYYVVYQDGYPSYSPADAFEAGYTLIS